MDFCGGHLSTPLGAIPFSVASPIAKLLRAFVVERTVHAEALHVNGHLAARILIEPFALEPKVHESRVHAATRASH